MKLDLGHVKLDGNQIVYDLDQSIGWIDHMTNFLKQFDNIALGMSGGVDSEAIGELLHRCQINFTPIIVDYCGANNHDTAYAIRWCNLRDYDYKIITLDPRKIWADVDSCLELASVSQCVSPQYLVYMNIYRLLAEHGSPIMAIGEPEIHCNNGQSYLLEKSMHFSVEVYKEHMNLPGTSLPFQKNKQAMSSWINDPFWKIIGDGQNSKWYKADWYHQQLRLFKRTKRDGFENLREEDKKLRTILEGLWPEEKNIIETLI